MDAFTNETLGIAILDDAAAETLSGDVRDALLSHLRSMKKSWPQLDEHEQRDLIYVVTQTAQHVVRTVANVMAQRGFAHLDVRIGKWTVKDGLKLEVLATGSVDNITHLAEHGAGGAVLVLVEVSQFFGEREAAKPDRKPDLFDERED